MNYRQKKKRVPKDTGYCYKTIKLKDGSYKSETCPFYQKIGYIDDVLVDVTGQHHPCKVPVIRCQLMKTTSEEDDLLLDRVKVCGLNTNYIEKG